MKNENRGLLLSISLLCSGRNKEEIIKCLDSLMTIRKRIPSEIIIVDTGCNSEIRSIIEEYADQVINFKWCDDFAKARNAGLKLCTGEWFLFVDDDEWFENTDDIVRFFKSGEYKEYGSARYKLRNYVNLEGTSWNDDWIGRLIKRTSNLQFIGKIHEYYSIVYYPTKWLDSYAHHYGYAYSSVEEKYTKVQRNIKPLIEMIKTEPKNLHWRTQLVQEYESINDNSRLFDLCTETLKIIEDDNTPFTNRQRADFYTGRMLADNKMYQFRQTVDDFNRFRKDRRNNSICMAMIYYLASGAYYALKDYENSYRYTVRYMQIFDKWKSYNDFNDKFAEEVSFITRDVFSNRLATQNLSWLIPSAVKMNHLDMLGKYFDRIDWNQCSDQMLIDICESITEAFTDNAYNDCFVDYANSMLSDDRTRARALYPIKKLEENTKTKDNSEKLKRIFTIYGNTSDCNDWYVLYLNLRYYDLIDDIDNLKKMYELLLSNVIDIFNFNKSVWDIAVRREIDLISLFKKIRFESWKRATDSFLVDYSVDQSDIVEELLDIMASDEGIRSRYFRLEAEEMLLITRYDNSLQVEAKHIRPGYEKEDKEAIEKARKKQKEQEKKLENKCGDICNELEKYCTDCVSFYQSIYSPDWFTGEMTVLPPQCRFAVLFLKAIDNGGSEKDSERIKKLEKCVDIYAPFNKALIEYIKEYGSKEKERLLRIQNNPELEKVYQMLDLLKQAIELQERTGSEELQAGIMQQRQLVESMLTSIIGDVSIDSEADNSCWILSVKELIENNGK